MLRMRTFGVRRGVCASGRRCAACSSSWRKCHLFPSTPPFCKLAPNLNLNLNWFQCFGWALIIQSSIINCMLMIHSITVSIQNNWWLTSFGLRSALNSFEVELIFNEINGTVPICLKFKIRKRRGKVRNWQRTQSTNCNCEMIYEKWNSYQRNELAPNSN